MSNINNIRKKVKLWIEILAVLFFSFSVITHIFLQTCSLVFCISLLVLLIILLTMLVLFEKLLKIDKKEMEHLENKFEQEKTELIETNKKLNKKLSLIEVAENKRLGNISKEEDIVRILNDFHENKIDAGSLLSFFSETFQAVGAILYVQSKPEDDFTVEAVFGLPEEFAPSPFALGEGLNGQAVLDGKPVIIENITEDYFCATSGLGNSKPKYLYLLPIIKEGKNKVLIELTSFENIQLKIENDGNAVETQYFASK